jgi:hypothetical protein
MDELHLDKEASLKHDVIGANYRTPHGQYAGGVWAGASGATYARLRHGFLLHRCRRLLRILPSKPVTANRHPGRETHEIVGFKMSVHLNQKFPSFSWLRVSPAWAL